MALLLCFRKVYHFLFSEVFSISVIGTMFDVHIQPIYFTELMQNHFSIQLTTLVHQAHFQFSDSKQDIQILIQQSCKTCSKCRTYAVVVKVIQATEVILCQVQEKCIKFLFQVTQKMYLAIVYLLEFFKFFYVLSYCF